MEVSGLERYGRVGVLNHDGAGLVVGEKIGGGSVSLDLVGPVVDAQLTAETNVVAVGWGRGPERVHDTYGLPAVVRTIPDALAAG
jgi:hypothetical protein